PPVTISQIQKALRKLTDPLTTGAGPVSVFLSPETGEPQGIFWKPSLRYESADRRDFPSFAPAIEFYARTFWESRKEQNAREQCRKFLEKELDFIHQEIQTIESLLTSDDEMAHLRSAGELLKLFSQLPVIAKRPDGAEVTNILSPNAEPFFIELDPRLTINQNMQRFFRLYRKAQTRNTLFSQKRKSLEAKKREYLHELDHLTHFPKEEIMPEGSSLPSPPSPFAPSGIRKFITPSRNEILVGKNDRANHQLVTRLAARNDYWLHVRDFPGSHVLLRITHSPESREEDLFRAARIAAYFSSARNETRVGVILTEVKHLRVIPGTGPGKVTFQHEKTLTISPAIPEDVKKIT
ncbi:MAG: NFACT RNA binding domain-containing protein, partial [Atribacterota bacterium]